MACDKGHTRRCILFAFQLGRNAAEAAKMISRVRLGKNWHKRSREREFNPDEDGECLGRAEKFGNDELQHPLDENSLERRRALAVVQFLYFHEQTLNFTKKQEIN
ncbi:hypothetical protein HN011_007665 [Eciton burchellii]|nr:hypothetical protein HN011_007665 [Eciton burchellii]